MKGWCSCLKSSVSTHSSVRGKEDLIKIISVEKLNWNHQEDDEDEFIGDEGDEEIGLSHSHEKKNGGALQQNKSSHSSEDQDYDGEDESDQSETQRESANNLPQPSQFKRKKLNENLRGAIKGVESDSKHGGHY